MRMILSALAGVVLSTSAFALEAKIPSGTYKLDPSHASLHWKVAHMGLSNYTARFTGLDATLVLDADNIENSKMEAVVDMNSVETDYPKFEEKDFDAELRTAPWFNTAEFPKATFSSTSIEVTGEDTLKAVGDLNFLGVSKPMTFDITVVGQLGKHPFAPGAALGFSAVGSFERSSHGFTTFNSGIGDTVQLVIEAEFIEQK